MITIKTEHEFSAKDISYLLATALEQGSTYWMEKAGRDKRKKPDNFKNTEPGDEHFTHISFPMNVGGYITIIETDDGQNKEHILDLAAITMGLDKMAKDKTYAFRFQNIVKDEYDACDADVFLQFAIFGEVLYG